MAPCKNGKVPEGVNGRCVKACEPHQTRTNYKCVNTEKQAKPLIAIKKSPVLKEAIPALKEAIPALKEAIPLKKKECPEGKVPEGVNGRCVNKCAPHQTRNANGRCVNNVTQKMQKAPRTKKATKKEMTPPRWPTSMSSLLSPTIDIPRNIANQTRKAITPPRKAITPPRWPTSMASPLRKATTPPRKEKTPPIEIYDWPSSSSSSSSPIIDMSRMASPLRKAMTPPRKAITPPSWPTPSSSSTSTSSSSIYQKMASQYQNLPTPPRKAMTPPIDVYNWPSTPSSTSSSLPRKAKMPPKKVHDIYSWTSSSSR